MNTTLHTAVFSESFTNGHTLSVCNSAALHLCPVSVTPSETEKGYDVTVKDTQVIRVHTARQAAVVVAANLRTGAVAVPAIMDRVSRLLTSAQLFAGE